MSDDPLMAMILRAILPHPNDVRPPAFGTSAIIDQEGVVLSNYMDHRGKEHFAVVVCHIDDLVANLRRLLDSLKVTDSKRHAIFRRLREWIKSDARPETEQAEDRVPIEYRRIN